MGSEEEWDAFNKFKRCVQEMNGKYVYRIFADIKGAFDNAWHVGILHQLMRWGCSRGMINLIADYLKDRVEKL